MSRRPLALDIETIGTDWDGLDEEVRDYLLRRARTEEEREEVPHRLGLEPGTGRIVAIGMWLPAECRGGLLLEGEGDSWVEMPDGPVPHRVFLGDERQLLTEFWQLLARDDVGPVITYNGRQFDGPFLMIRSAMLGVRPIRNLVPYRFSFREHCDLAEVLSLHRSRPLYSFDFWCRQFGVKSPKGDVDGSMVGELYLAGDLERIGQYCLGDARATAELYTKLLPMIEAMESSR